MKRAKFLLTIPSVTLVTFIPVITSCSNPQTIIEDIEDSIFHPIESKQIVDGTYFQQLQKASKEDLNKELIYRLFAPGEEWYKEIREFYDNNEIAIMSNIQTCKINFTQDNLNPSNSIVKASFVGYVNYVFKKDSEITPSFRKDDVIQISFLFDNINVLTSDDDVWYLKFPQLTDGYAYGFIEKIISGERQLPLVINVLEPQENIPNWHHWTNS